MNIMHLFLLLFLSTLVATTALTPSLSDSIIQVNREWTRFKLGIQGETDPFTYLYDEYPAGWNPVFNFIYIPNSKLAEDRRYSFKMRVRDSTGQIWSGICILEHRNNKTTLNDELFDYHTKLPLSFFNSQGFNGKSETVVNQLAINEYGTVYEPTQINESQPSIVEQINSLGNKIGSSTSTINEAVQQINKQAPEEKLVGVPTSLINLLRRNSLGYWDYYQTSFQYGSYRSDSVTATPSQSIASSSLDKTASIPVPKQIAPTTPQKKQNTTSTSNSPESKNPLNTPNNTATEKNMQKDITKIQVVTSNINSSPVINSSSTLSIPIDQIFLRLPTQEQLDIIILGADSLAMLKTIQNVIRSSLNCSDKVYYLQQFLGRIVSALSMKKFAASQLKVIIEAAQTQIARLTLELQGQRNKISDLNISQQKDQLEIQLRKLEQSYNAFNGIEIKIIPETAKVEGFQLEISKLRNSTNEYRSLVAQEKLKIVEIDADIQKLEAALLNAKNKRSSLQNNVKNLQQQISTWQNDINSAQASISSIEHNIDKLQQESDAVKIQSKTLEIIVDRIQKDLVESQQKEDTFKKRVAQLQEQIRLEKLKEATADLKILNEMVDSLERAVPSVKEQIDRYNYECLQLAIQSNKNEGDILLYIVGQKDYTQYILNIYGDVPIKSTQIKSSLQLSSLSILSPIWVSTFGNPFTTSQLLDQNEFSFGGDFNCLEPSQLISGSGIIREIRERVIFVETQLNGQRVQHKLYLGACSRVETTSVTPKLGQSIYWLGKQTDSTSYNTYRVTCI